jgi:hypothetical protein
LISPLALNRLRISEALGANITAMGSERGHHALTVLRKGGKIVTIPLAQRANSHYPHLPLSELAFDCDADARIRVNSFEACGSVLGKVGIGADLGPSAVGTGGLHRCGAVALCVCPA